MEFVQTRIGNEICSKASSLLGKLLKTKEQYTVYASMESCHEDLKAELAKGSFFVDKVYDGEGGVILILERT